MSDELPLGQREVDHNTTFTDEEINMIEAHGLTLREVRAHLSGVGAKSLETAIGSLIGAGLAHSHSKLSDGTDTET